MAADLFGDDLNFQLSGKNGEGEGSMSSLIQKAMRSILGPVAERVVELEDKCQKYEVQFKELNGRADVAVGRLDGHDQKAAILTSDLARTNEELRNTNDSVNEAHEKHAAIESDHDVTRSLANRTDTNHKNTASSLSDLHRLHEQLDSQVRQLQLALSETNIAHLNINDRVTELRNRHEGLNDRHLDLVKSMQETKQGDENTRQALKRFTTTFDKQRKDDQRSFSALDDRSKNLEAGLVEAQHQLDMLNKIAKNNKALMEKNKQALDGLIGEHQNQGMAQLSSKDFQGRMGKLEDTVANVAKTAQSEKAQTLNIVQAMSDAIHKNEANIQKNMSELEALDKGLKGHEHRLQKCEQLAGETASNHQRLKEQTDRAEADLRSNIAGVQRENMNQMDNQVHELAKTNAALQQQQSRVDAQANALQKVNGDLGSTQMQMGKLGSSLDLAHEYVQGLAKGFQHTHKRVAAGQDGMLGPKGTTNRRLPPVVATPRNATNLAATV